MVVTGLELSGFATGLSGTAGVQLNAEVPVAGAATGKPPGVAFLRASRRQQLLVAACDNGLLQLFDLRAQATPVASTRPANHDTSKLVRLRLYCICSCAGCTWTSGFPCAYPFVTVPPPL